MELARSVPGWARPWLAAQRGFCFHDFQSQPLE